MHGPGAELPVRAVQPPGGVRGVRRGDHGGVSAVPDVQHGDRPGGESDGRGGGINQSLDACLDCHFGLCHKTDPSCNLDHTKVYALLVSTTITPQGIVLCVLLVVLVRGRAPFWSLEL